MDKEEIKKYKVIKEARAAKKIFNNLLDSGSYHLIGTFKNESGELFVIYQFDVFVNPRIKSITGDEFGWELEYFVTKDGSCFKDFILSKDEIKEVKKILNGKN